jgi:hypothetical protein
MDPRMPHPTLAAVEQQLPALDAGRELQFRHSASIAFYRPQAEIFGGRSDGKLVVRFEKD